MKNILEYLEETTEKLPNKTAVICNENKLNYQELETISQKIGSFLSQIISPKKPVIVLMEKSIETLSTFLGVVYSGGFYINVNPSQPISRIKKIIEISKSEFIITDNCTMTAEMLEYQGAFYQYDDIIHSEVNLSVLKGIRDQSMDSDPLYCNFTSGTTGVPKGVLVSHQSVIDFMNYFPDLFGINVASVIGNQAPFDFDVSVKDIYSCLKTGATLVIIPKIKFSFVTQLIDYLEDKQVDTLIWAVSALCLLVDFKGFQYKTPKRINKVLFSGEVMPIRYLNQWRLNLPEASFVNLYGPTEITCNCTYYRAEESFELNEKLPIGKAFPNEKIILLDDHNQEVSEPYKAGEICVGGSCLALGYYNNPEQTEQRFVQNPANKLYYERIYRTGDLGYFDDKGRLHFSGRVDFQIKHMGHRIELEEIETIVNGFEGIERACCHYDQERSKIVLFFKGSLTTKEISSHLRQEVPLYMVPAKVFSLESFPLTDNGKVNRAALRSIYEEE